MESLIESFESLDGLPRIAVLASGAFLLFVIWYLLEKHWEQSEKPSKDDLAEEAEFWKQKHKQSRHE